MADPNDPNDPTQRADVRGARGASPPPPALSVLDQSFLGANGDAHAAFQRTIATAVRCEALGFRRFWVSEHHGSRVLAGSAPEVLLAAIGAHTRRIRIGSGGVMLPHYSPYKVAECFSVLANLYPGRVDLGVGRAPGGELATARALSVDGRPHFARFPQQVAELCRYLWDPQAKPRVAPAPPGRIPVWMLGTSLDSAELAARCSLPYTVALFIQPQLPAETIAHYVRRFVPSPQQPEPHAMLALNVVCCDDAQRAEALRKASVLNMLRFLQRGDAPRFLTPEEAAGLEVPPEARGFAALFEATSAIGTPDSVVRRIEALRARHGADEIMVVTNTTDPRDRERSFELLAEAFALRG